MLSHFSCVQLFVTLWTVALQVFLSVGFSRQEYWNTLPCPPLGDLPHPGIKPASPVAPVSQVNSLLQRQRRRTCHLLIIPYSSFPSLFPKHHFTVGLFELGSRQSTFTFKNILVYKQYESSMARYLCVFHFDKCIELYNHHRKQDSWQFCHSKNSLRLCNQTCLLFMFL